MVGATLMSYNNGAANSGAGNRTMAKGNTVTCAASGCHSGTTTLPTASIRLDSAGGVEVNQYVAGMTYTVTVTGKHATNTKFGFQYTAVSGVGSAQVPAGTFGTTLPAQVRKVTIPGLDIIEQSSGITDSVEKSFTWTAPATGTGNVSMYLTINATNGNGSAGAGDFVNTASKTITEYTPSSSVGTTTAVSARVFPNPTTEVLNIQLGNAYDNYAIQAYDMTGRIVASVAVTGTISGATTISTANWAPGMYSVVVSNETTHQTIQVLKK